MDTYDLQITKGETFNLSITAQNDDGSPIDLTNYVVSGYLKFKYSDSGRLTSLNPIVTIPLSGTVTLSIPATGSAILPTTIAVYDVEATNTGNGNVIKLLAGRGYIYPEVTY